MLAKTHESLILVLKKELRILKTALFEKFWIGWFAIFGGLDVVENRLKLVKCLFGLLSGFCLKSKLFWFCSLYFFENRCLFEIYGGFFLWSF